MTRNELLEIVKHMRLNAELNIRDYARINTPNVPEKDVDAIVNALDMISVDEAITVLWKIQRGNKDVKVIA